MKKLINFLVMAIAAVALSGCSESNIQVNVKVNNISGRVVYAGIVQGNDVLDYFACPSGMPGTAQKVIEFPSNGVLMVIVTTSGTGSNLELMEAYNNNCDQCYLFPYTNQALAGIADGCTVEVGVTGLMTPAITVE